MITTVRWMQGIQMFTAVKFYGVAARMCLFEGENHGLSRKWKAASQNAPFKRNYRLV